jgi:hypothetical protein
MASLLTSASGTGKGIIFLITRRRRHAQLEEIRQEIRGSNGWVKYGSLEEDVQQACPAGRRKAPGANRETDPVRTARTAFHLFIHSKT